VSGAAIRPQNEAEVGGTWLTVNELITWINDVYEIQIYEISSITDLISSRTLSKSLLCMPIATNALNLNRFPIYYIKRRNLKSKG